MAATSRCSSVVTSQRHDVWSTEERVNKCLNIATSSRFLPRNHKKKKRPNLEASKNVRTRVWKTEQQRLESLEKTMFLYFFFSHKPLMIHIMMRILSSNMF